jgi:hypothetical protein
MKKIIWIMLLSAGASAAQAQQQAVKLDQNTGWWTVESNVKSPKKQMVKFYNSDLQLLYEEAYDQKILNHSRKRTRRMLDSALAIVLKTKTGEVLSLANVIKRKR